VCKMVSLVGFGAPLADYHACRVDVKCCSQSITRYIDMSTIFFSG
jgi:hypothetical protein